MLVLQVCVFASIKDLIFACSSNLFLRFVWTDVIQLLREAWTMDNKISFPPQLDAEVALSRSNAHYAVKVRPFFQQYIHASINPLQT